MIYVRDKLVRTLLRERLARHARAIDELDQLERQSEKEYNQMQEKLEQRMHEMECDLSEVGDQSGSGCCLEIVNLTSLSILSGQAGVPSQLGNYRAQLCRSQKENRGDQ